jgi:hypothetical protein
MLRRELRVAPRPEVFLGPSDQVAAACFPPNSDTAMTVLHVHTQSTAISALFEQPPTESPTGKVWR